MTHFCKQWRIFVKYDVFVYKYRRLRGESAPAPPTGKSFRFVRACDARFRSYVVSNLKSVGPHPYLLSFASRACIFDFLRIQESLSREFFKRFLKESLQRQFAKKNLKESSPKEFSQRLLQERLRREFEKGVLKESFRRQFFKRILQESSPREFSKRVF